MGLKMHQLDIFTTHGLLAKAKKKSEPLLTKHIFTNSCKELLGSDALRVFIIILCYDDDFVVDNNNNTILA